MTRLTVVGDLLLDIDLYTSAVGVDPSGVAQLVQHAARHRPGGAGSAALLAAMDGHEVHLVTALAPDEAGRVGVTMLVPGGMDSGFLDARPDAFQPAPGQLLNRPEDVAASVLFALTEPSDCEVRELVVTPAVEPSWP